MENPIIAAARQLQKSWEAAAIAIEAGRAAKSGVIAGCQLGMCPGETIYLNNWDVEPDLSKLFERFVQMLDRAARRYLSREGITLSYDIDMFYTWPDEYELRSKCSFEDGYAAQLEAARRTSLLDLGQKLSAYLTPENARKVALTQAADFIFNEFRPERGYIKDLQVIESRGDRRVLHTRIWPDVFANRWELSHSCIERLCTTIQGINTLLQDSSAPDAVTAGGVSGAIHAIQMRGYSSRMKLHLGPQVEMLFFKEKLEYIFSSEAMSALQVMMQSNRTHEKDAA